MVCLIDLPGIIKCSTPVRGQIKVKNWVYMVVIAQEAISNGCLESVEWNTGIDWDKIFALA